MSSYGYKLEVQVGLEEMNDQAVRFVGSVFGRQLGCYRRLNSW